MVAGMAANFKIKFSGSKALISPSNPSGASHFLGA
jgi:hypothetical protein